ncbi:DUF3570 domain-containing protein [Neolewinella persica]|uniref:DUF3570 domain-containing protein n=1 Tax=Neolewinella persica TaxID=70998 RepID=UPI000374AF90|nr:DUF3570 domain-containing protein [Neolewinella persica]
MKLYLLPLLLLLLPCTCALAQSTVKDTSYKKRVLETAELQILTSYYSQDGNNAAVSGGTGTEQLTDIHPTVIYAVPLNDDDVLTVNVGISAYSSASSSNVNPFDGGGRADPFQASSGASKGDNWTNVTASYSHSSDDRNIVWSANLSGSTEYDYTSVGVGGSYTRIMNQKNTELSLKANVFIDGWNAIYPSELRPFDDGSGLTNRLFQSHTITGNANYNPNFARLDKTGRQSYNLGVNFSQILSRNLQGNLSLDVVQQSGLLSTPFQRVYFADIENSFIEDFALADDIERLPNSRTKIALGGRLHAYINERIVVRSFLRYYTDDWGINSVTANVEVPVKITQQFTLRPAFRYYTQTAADHFAPYDEHLSTSTFYTSDYDLSEFVANQYSLGVTYTDILASAHIWRFGLKSVDLNFSSYNRDNGFSAIQGAVGVKFVIEK